jgi:dolichol kinase
MAYSMESKMTKTLSLSSTKSLAVELHDLIHEIDAVRWRREMQAALQQRLLTIEGELASVMDGIRSGREGDPDHAALAQRLGELAVVLREYAPETTLHARAARREWRLLRKRLLPAYEGLARWLRAEEVVVPSIRPTNVARIVLHITGMLFVLTLLQIGLPGWGLITFGFLAAGTCWVLEALRVTHSRLNAVLMAFFSKVAHPTETHRVNSATWYITALFGLSLLWLMPGIEPSLVAGAAVGTMGVGDPVAGLAGRRWGRLRLANHRTLEGSLAFLVSAFVMVLAFIVVIHPAVSLGAALILAAGMSLCGALAELMSRRLDDNLTVPLCAALGGLGLSLLLG